MARSKITLEKLDESHPSRQKITELFQTMDRLGLKLGYVDAGLGEGNFVFYNKDSPHKIDVKPGDRGELFISLLPPHDYRLYNRVITELGE